VAKKKTKTPKKTVSAKTQPTPIADVQPEASSEASRPLATDIEKKPIEVEGVAGDDQGFPIVGIGASAGGLEALQLFFDAMPSDKAIAFVVVTHQQAGRTSLLPELLGKHTKMEVCEAIDGMLVEPNRVYIAPPDGQLHMLGRTLHLIPFKKGLHFSIDIFFRSLALDQKEHAIGIVLSGTGTDGSLGVKAIKDEFGMVMVQHPDSAKYDGMPRSAQATGAAEFVLPPEEMPLQLLKYVTGSFVAQVATTPLPKVPGLADAMPNIFVLLRNRTRHDFSHYKSNKHTLTNNRI
jgi:two-component system CheB/CheR fusion protein